MNGKRNGDEMSCIHVWAFVNYESQGIVCTKCGAYLDGTSAINHMNTLQSQLATRDSLLEWLVEAGDFAVRDYYGEDKANWWKSLVAEWRASKESVE